MIAWFARNGVAANLLLLAIVGAGLWTLSERLILEVFPEFESDVVQISLSYRGGTPSEIEEGMLVKIEEAIQDLEGIEELRSSAGEGTGSVSVEVESRYDPRVLLDDIKNRVDAISTFPDEAERPVYAVAKRRREVIAVVVSGEVPERVLRGLGERVRDDLTALPGISQVDLVEVRPYEISVELSREQLRAHGLTFEQVAQAVRRSSLDLPAGTLKTSGGEVRLRTVGQGYVGEDFRELVVIKREDGTKVTLGELADVHDGFEEEPVEATFNGEPCVMLEVYRVGDQNAIELADSVKAYLERAQPTFPPGVTLSYWRDRSSIITKRLTTLLTSALQGGFLVLLLLGMTLRPTIAGWVCVGIPVSFLGALAVLPFLGVTINILSLFAFILVLGIVVDDAIVTGENIYTHLRAGRDPTEAAIVGTQEVVVPVVFGVLTTMVAFVPIALLGGRRGPIFAQIPLIVIPVLAFSLVESKLVLPAHLRHVRLDKGDGRLVQLQQRLADGLENFALRAYKPFLTRALKHRGLTAAIAAAAVMIGFSAVLSGHVRFVFFPRVASETATGSLVMPEGTPFAVTRELIGRMADAAERLRLRHVDPETGESVIENVLATAGSAGSTRGQSHVGRVMFEIVSPEDRSLTISSSELVREWREEIGPLPGAKEVAFRAEIGRASNPIEVELAGHDLETLRRVSEQLKLELADYGGVFDITDSFDAGKLEVRLKLKPEAETLDLDLQSLARQVRQGFFGAEAQRIQRGRDDLRVMVRYAGEERTSLGHLEDMRVRTASGVEVPFSEVAEVELGRGFSTIQRVDRRRTVSVIADVNKQTADLTAIYADLQRVIDEVERTTPGVSARLAGEAEEQRDSFGGLGAGMLLVLAVIYALLAIAFRSYTQPLAVMCVIPTGWVGALLGHLALGMSLSIFSLMGMLALTGVVVNDSLVMVEFINRRTREGMPLFEAARVSGVSRFRPILLTSLTTVAGLVPLIFFERSTQAQFLIPMAVSLAAGVLFATFVTLLVLPVAVLLIDDGVRRTRELLGGGSTD